MERTYYKTLHGTCITKALKKPKPRKVGIFDVGTEKGRSVKEIVCKNHEKEFNWSKRPWMEEKRISSWWMVDLGEDHQLSIVGCSLCAATTLSDDGSRAYARSWKIQKEKTFIETVVADESDMEGVPPACSRILNWHLHLAALDVPYPQGVGVSYYDCSVRQLHVLEFWEEDCSDFTLINMVKYQAKPLVIYTSTKSEDSFVSALHKSDGTDEDSTVKLVKSSTFSYEQAWHRLVYLRVTGMDEGLNIKERYRAY
ncbi:hypothetical protein Bca52824_065807 [Brassica carinata]|uniref:Glycosyltransferases n=1 Tax=Brassica carinata TaxID=52824 RepID=A0A8X7QJF6_BRACI|nr:hypothetical protein Bca52824_065807 [Brassica carinata]